MNLFELDETRRERLLGASRRIALGRGEFAYTTGRCGNRRVVRVARRREDRAHDLRRKRGDRRHPQPRRRVRGGDLADRPARTPDQRGRDRERRTRAHRRRHVRAAFARRPRARRAVRARPGPTSHDRGTRAHRARRQERPGQARRRPRPARRRARHRGDATVRCASAFA